jgi:hypothetical protein
MTASVGVKLLLDPRNGNPRLDLPADPPEDIEVSVQAVDHLRTHPAFGIQLVDRPPVVFLVIRTGQPVTGSAAPVGEILAYRLERYGDRDRDWHGHRIA